jgi:hypothetical protein
VIRRAHVPPAVPPILRTYLGTGEAGADVEVYALAGAVLRGQLQGLRAAWNLYGPEIMRTWPVRGEPRPFALEVLEDVADGDWQGVLAVLAARRKLSDTEESDE